MATKRTSTKKTAKKKAVRRNTAKNNYGITKRQTTPKYEPNAFRTAEEAARDYDKMADLYERMAADARAFNKARRSQGKPAVKSVENSARSDLNKAKTARAYAKRLRETGTLKKR